MTRPLIILATAAAVLGTGTPAAAGTIVIPFRDIDLSTIEGRDRLEARIDRRARNYCGVGREARDSQRVRDCYAYVLAQASIQVAAIVGRHRLGG